ncbi:amino acid kinase [Methanosarcinales archaeon]|nr:MAG: amino acid kinase [Methanosarcinales archaeon]RLI02122.1 MAG: amino acid kinase [Candidatus Bathyarchaeota archaeon]
MFVVKFGGSLIDCARNVVGGLVDYAESTGRCILIVPGGGVFADVVRHVDARLGLSSDVSHWMAVLGTEQYGLLLCDGTGAVPVRSKPDGSGVFVLLACQMVRGLDELEHSWAVTGDTIAAWVADKYRFSLIKATDVEGIYVERGIVDEICASRLSGLDTCVDAEFPEFLSSHGLDCRVVCGRSVEPLIAAIEGDRGGTLIRGC